MLPVLAVRPPAAVLRAFLPRQKGNHLRLSSALAVSPRPGAPAPGSDPMRAGLWADAPPRHPQTADPRQQHQRREKGPKPQRPWKGRFCCRFFSTASGGGSDSPSRDPCAQEPTDFFELFGLPRRFGIPLRDLKRTYLGLMNEHHPDKRVQRGGKPGEGAIAAETITHAYQTLRDPHARACHWLELHGCPLGEERESGSPTDLVGTDFLLGVMERREAIEDHEGDAEALGALAGEVEGLRASCEAALEDLMDEGEGRGSSEHQGEHQSESVLERARRLTAQLQYWNRLEEALEEAAEP